MDVTSEKGQKRMWCVLKKPGLFLGSRSEDCDDKVRIIYTKIGAYRFENNLYTPVFKYQLFYKRYFSDILNDFNVFYFTLSTTDSYLL